MLKTRNMYRDSIKTQNLIKKKMTIVFQNFQLKIRKSQMYFRNLTSIVFQKMSFE